MNNVCQRCGRHAHRARYALCAATLLWLARPACGEVLTESQPFISPKGAYVTQQDAYHTFRIPGLAVAPDGSILAFAEGRRGDGSDPRRDDNAPIDLVMRRSTDLGQTWEELVVLDSGYKPGNVQVDFGDPTPVVDQTTGKVFVVYGQWPDFGPLVANWGQDPNSANDNQVVWVQSSSDNGQTWSGPTQIDYPDHPNETADGLYWRNAEPGPGSGIQLQWQENPSHNGRLVIPAKRAASTTVDGNAASAGFVYYSDDQGASWQVGQVASAGGNENEVVELISGNLLLDARANPRTRFVSDNAGIDWSDAPVSDVPVTTVDASLIRYSAVRSGDALNRLLFSGPGGTPVGAGNNRSNQLVWTSYDEGMSFINPVQFTSEQAAYSVLAKLPDASIAMVVESSGDESFNLGQSYGDITYYGFGIDHLEGAAHPAGLSHYDGFGNPIDPFRGGVGWSGAWNQTGIAVAPGVLEFPGFLTEGDQQHIHLQGNFLTRQLGLGALDLDADRDYYATLFVERAAGDQVDDDQGEWLDIRWLDQGVQRFAVGVNSDEAFFVRNESDVSDVVSAADALAPDTTYVILMKLSASDGATGAAPDQVHLAWYDDPAAVPADESAVVWQLAGEANNDVAGTIDAIFIGAGDQGAWKVDGLRIGATYDSVVVDTGVAGPPVRGDLNGDQRIDLQDWIVFRNNLRLDTGGLPPEGQVAAGDFDVDGVVDPGDYVEFVALYNAAHGAEAFQSAVSQLPEPDTAVLALAASWATWLRRHRDAGLRSTDVVPRK